MKYHVLSVYQPEGTPPPQEFLDRIMGELAVPDRLRGLTLPGAGR